MKARLKQKIEAALQALIESGEFEAFSGIEVQVTRCKDKAHGDFTTNLGMLLAKPLKRPPREVAQKIADRIGREAFIEDIQIAGPGFLNIKLSEQAKREVLMQVFDQADRFGRCDLGAGQRVQIEFVSANPTGPLHVGHGRGAAYGAALADLLEAAGYTVEREYYINDAGRQMDILAASVWLRYLELCGEDLPFPANAYKGDYVWDIAATLHREHADAYRKSPNEILSGLPPDEPQGGDKELYIDAMIAKAKSLLGAGYRTVFAAGLDTIVADIRDDLEKFGVVFQRWYPESTLFESGRIPQALERLRASGKVYEKDGATWFRSTDFGDEKDRVVLRDNGQPTYFASDIAYHLDKYQRGYDLMINIWGADHHGYVARLKAAIAALGENPEKLDVLLVQFAILYRGNVKQQMSTRSGEFVTLRELRKEVGSDAARFFYVQRKCEQHLDFDLDLAKAQSTDNPVYYLQYAHARICSVFRQLEEQGREAFQPARGSAGHALLTEPKATGLIDELARYPEVVEAAARAREPHQVGNYLRELANAFHGYYDSHKMLLDDLDLRDARLSLALATRQVLKNGLRLLGVSAPERMTREA